MGNKGAVAASLSLYGTSVCFLCSHLAAGSKGPAARNEEMVIIGKMFGKSVTTIQRLRVKILCYVSVPPFGVRCR